jgi:hypothetical protein
VLDCFFAIGVRLVHVAVSSGGHPRRCPLRGRRAVWWDHRRGQFSRLLTIYAGYVESVSGWEIDIYLASL